jgi:hypothetical protein
MFSLVSIRAIYTSPHANQDNYYIACVVFSKVLEAYVPQIHILNLILDYFYLRLLIMCLLLSLGNQSQGSKWVYTFAFKAVCRLISDIREL